MPRRPAQPADAEVPSTRYCEDCVPPLWIQCGDWGWRAHRHALHGEGSEPGPHPPPTVDPPKDRQPWTAERHAEFHRRRIAERRRNRYARRSGRRA